VASGGYIYNCSMPSSAESARMSRNLKCRLELGGQV